MPRSGGRIVAVAWALAVAVAPVWGAEGSIAREVFARAKSDRSSTSIGVAIEQEELARLPAASRSFTEILFSVPGVQSADVSAGHLPDDWSFDANAMSASGPAIDGGHFRLDVPIGWTPRKRLGIELRSGGRSIWKDKVDLEVRDPIDVSHDLGQFLDLPRTVHGGSEIALPDGTRNKWGADLTWDLQLRGVFRLPAGVDDDGWTADDTKVFTSSFFLTGMAAYVGDGWRPFGIEDGRPVPGPRTESSWNELGAERIGVFRTIPDHLIRRRGEPTGFEGSRWSITDEDVESGGFGLGSLGWLHEPVRFEPPVRTPAETLWGAPRAVWRLRGADPFGETVVDGVWTPVVLPPLWPDSRPAFTGVTEVVAPHESFCVTGRVGGLDQWNGLRIGGVGLGAPIFATDSSAVFLPPAGLDPGVHQVTYAPWEGTDPDTGLSTAYITIQARIHQQKIKTGNETRLTLGIVGTDRSFPVKLVNKSPTIINLEGEIEHHDRTTGGADNRIEKTILGLTPGDYDIYYEVELPTCPGEKPDLGAADAGDSFVQALAGWSSSLGGTPSATGASPGVAAAPEPTHSGSTPGGSLLRDRPWHWGTFDQEKVEATPGCTPGAGSLILRNDRFRVEVDFRDNFEPRDGGACVQAQADDTGLFYYFHPENWKMLVKVLDGCSFNDRFWVFSAATTNVEYTLKVTDTQTTTVRTYRSPLGDAVPAITDTAAFATCP